MKEQELLFLGFLIDGPKHGYQLKKMMREISSTFGGLKTNSIYYPLKKMLRYGLINQSTGKEGRRPVRYTYNITSKGREEFNKLLSKNILNIERPYFSLDLSLYFLRHIPKGLRQRYLRIRLRLLNKLRRGLIKLKRSLAKKSSPHLIAILEHNEELLGAEVGFITRLSLCV